MKNKNEYTMEEVINTITRLNQEVMARAVTLQALENKIKELEEQIQALKRGNALNIVRR